MISYQNSVSNKKVSTVMDHKAKKFLTIFVGLMQQLVQAELRCEERCQEEKQRLLAVVRGRDHGRRVAAFIEYQQRLQIKFIH